MKIAIYPGSFNPWHKGHEDIVKKALEVFDVVHIAMGINPEKKLSEIKGIPSNKTYGVFGNKIVCSKYKGLLVDHISFLETKGIKISAVIRGLRNANDLLYEQTTQYWNEDLGIKIPTVYFVSDRKLLHISSSAIRSINTFKGVKND